MVAWQPCSACASFSHRPRPEAVRLCVVSMVAADSEGPEDCGARQDRLEGWGWIAGVTSDLGVSLQVAKLWKKGLEASFCLLNSDDPYYQVFPSSFFQWIPRGPNTILGLSPAPWGPLLLVIIIHHSPRGTYQSRVSLSDSLLHLTILLPCPSVLPLWPSPAAW